MISINMNPTRIDLGIKKERECPTRKIPSLDSRALGAVTPPRKSYN